jgi:hypothetical protein
MNATLKRLQELLNSPQPPEVVTLDSFHVPPMKIVERGTPGEMKRCLLNLPPWLTFAGQGKAISGSVHAADFVFGLMGTKTTNVYWDAEMIVLKNREVRREPPQYVAFEGDIFRL